MPNNCVFLVDTYDTLRRRAATPSRSASGCAAQGHEMVGIRLDSGDLAYLSIEARQDARRGRLSAGGDRGLATTSTST